MLDFFERIIIKSRRARDDAIDFMGKLLFSSPKPNLEFFKQSHFKQQLQTSSWPQNRRAI